MSQNRIFCVFHSADYDGEFCHQIAKKFLPQGTTFIGWNFGDPPLSDELLGLTLIVMDLPIDRVFGLQFKDGWICKGSDQIQPIDRWDSSNITWIDHHKSSIETHPTDIPGYRIEGVAACRLAWQWFQQGYHNPKNFDPPIPVGPLPQKEMFVNREVTEPLAVRLAAQRENFSMKEIRE